MESQPLSTIKIGADDLIEMTARLITWEIPPAAIKGCAHEQLELDIAEAMKRAVAMELNKMGIWILDEATR